MSHFLRTLEANSHWRHGKMDKQIELSQTEIELAFASFCIEGTARKFGKPYQEVFSRMNVQNPLNDPLKSPKMQDYQIGSIAAELAKRLDIAPARALQLFYESQTCADLHNKKTGLYLFSNLYIADEFILEYEYKM